MVYDFINIGLTFSTNKNIQGTANELLICGNLSNFGFTAKVLNDHNKDYDIEISKDNYHNFVECKLDRLAITTGNFYFEY